MANSILFDGLVNTFDDVKDLEEWAIEYGHSHELVVRERITLRNQSISESMDISPHNNSNFQLKTGIIPGEDIIIYLPV